jgi:hypothetical protein
MCTEQYDEQTLRDELRKDINSNFIGQFWCLLYFMAMTPGNSYNNVQAS